MSLVPGNRRICRRGRFQERQFPRLIQKRTTSHLENSRYPKGYHGIHLLCHFLRSLDTILRTKDPTTTTLDIHCPIGSKMLTRPIQSRPSRPVRRYQEATPLCSYPSTNRHQKTLLSKIRLLITRTRLRSMPARRLYGRNFSHETRRCRRTHHASSTC
jgi:hypothetical protein